MRNLSVRLALAVLSLSVLAPGAFAQEGPTVDFSGPVMKASAVLDALSKKTGVHLASDPIVGNIPILVRVKAARLENLLAKIAEVVGGEIKAEGEGFRLVNDQDQRRQESSRERAWMEQAFERAKRKATEGAKGLGRWDDKTVSQLIAAEQKRREQLSNRYDNSARGEGQTVTTIYDSRLTNSSPASSAAVSALSMTPASVLASVGPGDRIVYSTTPNRMQRRIPFNVAPIANDFYYNYNIVAQRAPELRQDPRYRIWGGLSSGPPVKSIAETHMILSRGYRSNAVTLTIKFVDGQGLYVGEGSATVVPDFGVVQPVASEEGRDIELSELSRQMAVIMAQEIQAAGSDRQVVRLVSPGGSGSLSFVSSGGTGLSAIIPGDLLNVFVNPDRYDPTSLYVSESYSQVAEAEGKNLVATFPDSIVKGLARILVKGRTTSKGVLAASGSLGINVSTEGEWMTLTPAWADNARETRFDRAKAARLFRSVNSRGFATLDELADYSVALVTGAADSPLDMAYLGLINRDVYDQFDTYVSMNLDLLRLYATLPNQMKSNSGPEARTPYRTLLGASRTYADRAVYNRSTGFVRVGGSPGQQYSIAVEVRAEGNRAGGAPENSILSESTEALPNGIPGDADISLTQEVQNAVFAMQKGFRGGKFMTSGELAQQRKMALSANFAMPMYDAFLLGQVANMSVRISTGATRDASATFTDGRLLVNATQLSFDQLPEEFRNATVPVEITVPVGAFRSRGGGG